jgi:hypothetical protein
MVLLKNYDHKEYLELIIRIYSQPFSERLTKENRGIIRNKK